MLDSFALGKNIKCVSNILATEYFAYFKSTGGPIYFCIRFFADLNDQIKF